MNRAAQHAEEWRPVLAFEGWVDASDNGRVRVWYSLQKRGPRPAIVTKLAEPVVVPYARGKYGRPIVFIRNSERSVSMPVQRAVVLAFLGEPPAGHVSCHFPDRDMHNCRRDNLRWDSERENAADAAAHRTCDQTVIQTRLDLLRERFPHLSRVVDARSLEPLIRARRVDSYDSMLERMQAERMESP